MRTRIKFGRAIVGLMVVLASVMGSMSTGEAGEAIRFIRPKADAKAPLRVNYSAEKAQSKERVISPVAVRGPGSPVAQPSGGPSAVVSRRAQEAALARKNWMSSESDAPQKSRVNQGVWREDESPGEFGLSGNNGVAIFSSHSTLSLGSPHSEASKLGAVDRRPGFGAEGGRSPRTLADFGLGSIGNGDLLRAPARGEMSGVAAGERIFQSGQGSLVGGASGPADRLNGSLSPRGDVELPGSRGAGLGNPGVNLVRPESSPSSFDPSSRPLRSNFDLPARPR